MGAEFPRCSVCRVAIQPGIDAVFDPDGRVHHVDCPMVICPVCCVEIRPDTPIRRDGAEVIHGDCWLRRERQRVGTSAPFDGDRIATVRARLAAGGVPSAPSTKILGGTSKGAICAACTDMILAGQIEYELEFAGAVAFRLHRSCFLIWQQERGSVGPEISGASERSAAMLVVGHDIGQRAARDHLAFTEFLAATSETRRAAVELRETSKRIRATTAALCVVSQRVWRRAELQVARARAGLAARA